MFLFDVFATSGSRLCIIQRCIQPYLKYHLVKNQGRLHPDRAPRLQRTFQSCFRRLSSHISTISSEFEFVPYRIQKGSAHCIPCSPAHYSILAPSGVYFVEQNRPPLHFIVLGQYASFLWCHMTLGVLRRRRLFEEVLFTRGNPRRNCAIGTQWRLPPQARG
jgi:hypothetical protein